MWDLYIVFLSCRISNVQIKHTRFFLYSEYSVHMYKLAYLVRQRQGSQKNFGVKINFELAILLSKLCCVVYIRTI